MPVAVLHYVDKNRSKFATWCAVLRSFVIKSLDAGPYFCKELTQYLVAAVITTPLNLHA